MMPQMNPNYSAMATTGFTGTTVGTTMGTTPGIGLSDRDLFQTMLNEQKYLNTHITSSIMESSNPQLRQEYIHILNRGFEHQRMIYDAMNQRGWYHVIPTTSQTMQGTQSYYQPHQQQYTPSQTFNQPYQMRVGYPQQQSYMQPGSQQSFQHSSMIGTGQQQIGQQQPYVQSGTNPSFQHSPMIGSGQQQPLQQTSYMQSDSTQQPLQQQANKYPTS